MSAPPPPGDLSFSLVRDDPWYRLQRVLRLVPANGKDGVFRRILFFIVFAWLWRILLFGLLLKRVAGLGLDLVPTHPDRLGGLGFVPVFPVLFAPFAFALSCILASKWAHEIAWHGAHVRDFKLIAGLFLAVLLVLCLSPLAVFTPLLKRTRRKALADYGNLIARHGRLVRHEWIEGRPVADRALLEAPELGPACDIGAIHDSVVAMRNIPLTKASVLVLVLPAALPMILVATMEIPVVELLGKLFKTLL